MVEISSSRAHFEKEEGNILNDLAKENISDNTIKMVGKG